jgi:hypothetical protein
MDQLLAEVIRKPSRRLPVTERTSALIIPFPIRHRRSDVETYMWFWFALWQANLEFWIGRSEP